MHWMGLITYNFVQPLANEQYICDIQMVNLQQLINAEGRNITLAVSDAAEDWLNQMKTSNNNGGHVAQNLVKESLPSNIRSSGTLATVVI